MIEIQKIRKDYDDFRLEVDFRGPDRGILTLLGASGSGKTTTLRIVAGFEKPDSGKIFLGGSEITSLPVSQRKIGFVFQDYALFPHLSVAGNIAYGLGAQGWAKMEQERRVRELLELTGLEGFGDRRVTNLSGGEQQRVALARALAPRPQALLLDEPFSAVDPERREELGRYLRDLQHELALPMVFVTHSRQEALAIASTILLMKEGSVVESGSPHDLYTNPNHEYTARFLGKANILSPEAWTTLGVDVQTFSEPAYLVRPENIELLPPGLPSTRGVGTISNRMFRGSGWEYEVQCQLPDGPGLLTVLSSQHEEIGATKVLRVNPSHCTPILPSEQP
ncbi:MAG: ABC transporter ATP-binding protein [Spirochaetales bacterium]|nr:ABC transporter ATP-binding protein [Spirochaetales bacterium]